MIHIHTGIIWDKGANIDVGVGPATVIKDETKKSVDEGRKEVDKGGEAVDSEVDRDEQRAKRAKRDAEHAHQDARDKLGDFTGESVTHTEVADSVGEDTPESADNLRASGESRRHHLSFFRIFFWALIFSLLFSMCGGGMYGYRRRWYPPMMRYYNTYTTPYQQQGSEYQEVPMRNDGSAPGQNLTGAGLAGQSRVEDVEAQEQAASGDGGSDRTKSS